MSSVEQYVKGPRENREKIKAGYLNKTQSVLNRFPEDLALKKTLYKLNEATDPQTVVTVLETETEEQIYKRVKTLYDQSV